MPLHIHHGGERVRVSEHRLHADFIKIRLFLSLSLFSVSSMQMCAYVVCATHLHQVPLFNGSSYLRFAPLGDTALIWLELKVSFRFLPFRIRTLFATLSFCRTYVNIITHLMMMMMAMVVLVAVVVGVRLRLRQPQPFYHVVLVLIILRHSIFHLHFETCGEFAIISD